MKILVDINHPAHVHLFKNAVAELKKRGHQILITTRDKDVTTNLLTLYSLDHVICSRQRKGKFTLPFELLIRILNISKETWHFKPDIFVSLGSPAAAIASKIFGKPHIAFDDTEHAIKEYRIYAPFTNIICTPSCFQKNLGDKQVRYNGYHELAYLHPNWFNPNPEVLKELGLSENERFFIVRFVSWQATHDIGEKGFTNKGKRKLIKELEKYGRVIITAESHLPEEFKKYRMPISPTKIHDLLYYATMYIGEGATMASEAAVLGTPAIFVSSITAGTLEEQEKRYGLLYSFRNEDKAIKKILGLFKTEDLKQQWQKKREIMLKDKIDVTTWMIDLIERKNIPQ